MNCEYEKHLSKLISGKYYIPVKTEIYKKDSIQEIDCNNDLVEVSIII